REGPADHDFDRNQEGDGEEDDAAGPSAIAAETPRSREHGVEQLLSESARDVENHRRLGGRRVSKVIMRATNDIIAPFAQTARSEMRPAGPKILVSICAIGSY